MEYSHGMQHINLKMVHDMWSNTSNQRSTLTNLMWHVKTCYLVTDVGLCEIYRNSFNFGGDFLSRLMFSYTFLIAICDF